MKTGFYIGVGAAAAVASVLYIRRLGHRWGATDDEVYGPLPGDEAVTLPVVETTHAVTIHAPASDVWPWLVQMGYGRAGWYTNQWWYRQIDTYIFHVNMPRMDRIDPELQHLAVGDIIPDGPPGTASFSVLRVEPEQALVLYSTTHGTVWLPRNLRDNRELNIHCELGWAFVLREPAPGTTRLLLRSRVSGGPALYRMLMTLLLPPADFVVARLMLRTIKRNVEQEAVARPRAEAAPSGVASISTAKLAQ